MQEMDKAENILMAHFRNFLTFPRRGKIRASRRTSGKCRGGFQKAAAVCGDIAAPAFSRITQCSNASVGHFRFFNPSLFLQFWAQLQFGPTFNRLHLGNCCMTRIFGAFKGEVRSRKAPREVSHSVKVSKSLHAVSTAVTGCSCSAFIGGKQANNRVIHPWHMHPQNITSNSKMSK